MEEQKHKHVISFTIRTCVRLGVTAFLIYLAITLWNPLIGLLGRFIKAAVSLIVGFALAYMVNILMSVYERHYFRKKADQKWVQKSRRPVCLIAAIVTILGAVILLLYIVVPQLMRAITLITGQIPELLQNLSRNEKIMRLLPEELQAAIQNLDYQKIVDGFVSFLTNGASSTEGVMNALSGVLGSLTSGVMTCFMGFIFSIYILLGKERLARQFGRLFRSYLGTRFTNWIHPVFSTANACFHNFIVGQVTEGVIIGVLCALGMTILRLPYPAMIGTVIGVTALIPVLGCYLGAIIGALMCLSVSLTKAVMFLVFIFCLQQFEDNLIYPRVVGTSLGLPAIWVIASVTVGGGFGGFLGMILAVPVTATIYMLLRRGVQNRERADSGKRTASDVIGKLKEGADD